VFPFPAVSFLKNRFDEKIYILNLSCPNCYNNNQASIKLLQQKTEYKEEMMDSDDEENMPPPPLEAVDGSDAFSDNNKENMTPN